MRGKPYSGYVRPTKYVKPDRRVIYVYYYYPYHHTSYKKMYEDLKTMFKMVKKRFTDKNEK